MFIGATDSLFEALCARRRVSSGEGGCDGGEGASSVRSVREVQKDHWSGRGLFLMVLAELKRAVAAAQRYAELKRVGAATLTRDGIAPADIPRRIFNEFYSCGEVVKPQRGDAVRSHRGHASPANCVGVRGEP